MLGARFLPWIGAGGNAIVRFDFGVFGPVGAGAAADPADIAREGVVRPGVSTVTGGVVAARGAVVRRAFVTMTGVAVVRAGATFGATAAVARRDPVASGDRRPASGAALAGAFRLTRPPPAGVESGAVSIGFARLGLDRTEDGAGMDSGLGIVAAVDRPPLAGGAIGTGAGAATSVVARPGLRSGFRAAAGARAGIAASTF